MVNYILDKGKDAKILVCDGLFAEDRDTIAMSFEAQSKMNPRVMKPVGHISLAFHKEDEHRLTDRAMAGMALEYLKGMGITDTQVLIVRIANNGRTISDRNERIRSARICKELTKKYNLYFANGKERVKQHRLKEPDKTKYGLYSILKSEVSRCGNWNILAANLKKQGVDMRFKYKGKSDEVQGVVFTMNGYSFSGSKIDRRFSFSKIDAALERNRRTERMNMQPPSRHEELPTFQPESRGNDDLYNGSIGLFMPDNADGQAEENRFEEELKRRNKKKKQRKIRF